MREASSLTAARQHGWAVPSGRRKAQIYVSCLWLPAIAAFQLLWATQRGATRRAAISSAFKTLTNSIVLLIAVFASISLIYLLRIHHFPDWYAFLEFGFLYSGGAGVATINPWGGVWGLLFTLAIIASTTLLVVRNKKFDALPPLVGCWGGFWALCSYFIYAVSR